MKAIHSVRLVALAVLLTAGAASAQHQWQSQFPMPGQFAPATASIVQLGTRAISGDDESGKYSEYREFAPQALFGNALIHEESADQSRFYDLWVVDPGEDDARYVAGFGEYGEYAISVFVDQLPHVYSTTARSLYVERTPGVLEFPDAAQVQLQGLAGAARSTRLGQILSTSPQVPLRFDQSTYGVNAKFKPADRWNVTASYSEQGKNGTRPWGMGFGSPGGSFVNVAAPIDQDIHDVRASVEHVGEGWNARADYWGSFFNNNLDTLTVDNPLQFTNAAAVSARGRADFEPNNDSHQFNLTAGTKLDVGWPARLTGTVSFGSRNQNDLFVPHTINPVLAGSPAFILPRASLFGDADTFLANVQFNGRPAERLNVVAKLRYFELDDTTPALTFPGHSVNDASIVLDPRRITPTEYDKFNGSLDGIYRFSDHFTFRGGFRHESFDRPAHRERTEVDEDTYKLSADWLPGRDNRWVIRPGYEYSDRDGNTYDPFAHLHATEEEDDPAAVTTGQSVLLRKFVTADRRQHKGTLFTQFNPRNDVSLGVNGAYSNADYQNSPLGLQADERFSIGTDANYALNDRTQVSSFVNYEKIRARQRNRWRTRVGAGTNDSPVNDWFSDTIDRVNTYGANLRHEIKPGKWDTQLFYTHQRGHGQTLGQSVPGVFPVPSANDGGAAVSFPELRDKLQTFAWLLRHHLKQTQSLQLEYRYEHYSQSGFKHDGLNPFMPFSNVTTSGVVSPSTDVFLGDQYGIFDIHALSLSLLQRF